MARKITKYQAEATLRAVKKQFSAWFERDEDGPKLIMDWDFFGYGPNPAIVWEGGPYDWPHLVNGGIGDFNEKYAPVKLPKNVWIEAATGFAISLYRED